MGQQKFSKSQFYMWRAVIAIAHADGEVQAEERAYITRVISTLDRVYGLTQEQKKAFTDDLVTPQKIEDMVKEIEEPQYRGMLITLGETMVWADGVVTEDEEAVLKKLHANRLGAIDSDRLRNEMKQGTAERRAEFEAENAKLRNDAHSKNPLFRALDRVLVKMGIDLLK
ncbi:MAG: DUF533 domain-containing protein [Alphaproteobacteria bacterium]